VAQSSTAVKSGGNVVPMKTTAATVSTSSTKATFAAPKKVKHPRKRHRETAAVEAREASAAKAHEAKEHSVKATATRTTSGQVNPAPTAKH
jgi:hypothetical protein